MAKLNPDKIDKMSHDQLVALGAQMDAAPKTLAGKRRSAAFADVWAVLKEYAVTVDEIMGRKTGQKLGMPARYRHPENPAVTWSGHGRRPAWFREAVERGVAAETMSV